MHKNIMIILELTAIQVQSSGHEAVEATNRPPLIDKPLNNFIRMHYDTYNWEGGIIF